MISMVEHLLILCCTTSGMLTPTGVAHVNTSSAQPFTICCPTPQMCWHLFSFITFFLCLCGTCRAPTQWCTVLRKGDSRRSSVSWGPTAHLTAVGRVMHEQLMATYPFAGGLCLAWQMSRVICPPFWYLETRARRSASTLQMQHIPAGVPKARVGFRGRI